MHGRLKVKTSVEKEREKDIERKQKLVAFQTLSATITKHRAEDRLDEDLLLKTRVLLSANPDIYTLWNIRRQVFLAIKLNNCEEAEFLFKKELEFVVECLKVNPKSYGAWQQRCFVQTSMQHPDWKQEMSLCDQFLEVDDRNFHCWDYRRFVVQHANISPQLELIFTTNKINADFSNFSSWHYRGSLLKNMCGGELDAELLGKELSLVENALFTDPNDQSAWFYHGWLLSDKINSIRLEGVVVDKESSRVLLIFNRAVKMHTDIHIDIRTDTQRGLDCQWTGVNKSSYNKVYIANYELGKEENKATNNENIPYNNNTPNNNTSNNNNTPNNNTPNNNNNTPNNTTNGSFKEMVIEIKGKGVIDGRVTKVVEMGCGDQLINATDYHTLFKSSRQQHTFLLNKHLQQLQQLQAIESDNKWVVMAIWKLVGLLDTPDVDVTKWLERLSEEDVYRRCFYEDMIGKLKIERKLKAQRVDNKNDRGEQPNDDCQEHRTDNFDRHRPNSINLSNSNLSKLHHTNHLIAFENIDLSNNQLTFLKITHPWIFMVRLKAARNKLVNCEGMAGWTKVQCLDLSYNDLKSLNDLKELKTLKKLQDLFLAGNPLLLTCSRLQLQEYLPHAINIHTEE